MRSRGRQGLQDAGRSGRPPACRRTARRSRGPRRAAAKAGPLPTSSRLREDRQMTQTAVLLCGHGSRDPEAIAEFELAAAALRPRLPEFDFATGYLEFARPTIRDGLALLAKRGARRILAIPGMLFAASHVKNDLPWEINSFIADNPGLEFVKALYLRDHQGVLDAFCDRVSELGQGQPAMNCQLCKYRTQIIGYENDAGALQTGHHHHVRGIDTEDHQHHPHR